MALELRPALIVARREVRDQFRDWRIIFPIIFLTLFFPFLMNWTAQIMLNFVRGYGASIIGERMVPFLLMIVGFFPISTSLVIALESFVGEKERGSIEPLLSSPLKDWQLYLGKLLSSTAPPLLGSFTGMAVYLAGLALSHVALPDANLLVQILVLTVVQAVVMVSGAVVVSTQATSVRASNLLASFIVIPMALLVQGESVVMFWGRNTLSLWWIVLGLAVLAALLVRVGLSHFQREELLGHELDVLNLRWGWHVFKSAFSGGARNILDWFGKAWRDVFSRMKWTLLAVTGVTVASVFLGAGEAAVFPIHFSTSVLPERLQEITSIFPLVSPLPVMMIFWQNLRVLLLGLVLGILSFGVLGIVPVLATMGLSGYLVQILVNNGLHNVPLILGFFLPHGILEIPAMIISCAAVLHIGLRLATPRSGKTVGEVFLTSLAEWVKITLAVVIPLLLVAAFLEAWVTPRVVLALLH